MPRVPADWEPQKAIWIAWPHRRSTWPGRFETIAPTFRRFIQSVADCVPARIIGSADLRAVAKFAHSNATWLEIATDDCWIRDYGPLFVDDADPYAVDWTFNAWGGKYPPWELDNAAGSKIIDAAHWRRVNGRLCLEGGAMEWDGGGRLLTTDCLLTPSRTPGASKEQIADRLHEVTGTNEIVWVNGGGLAGDDTDGHIDQLARFVDRENVVVAVSDPDDENHTGLESNFEILKRWGNATAPQVEVHRLPIPPARHVEGQRVPESYCNYLRLGNDRLLVPTFGDRDADDVAIGILGDLARLRAPSIEVLGVDCRDLVWGLGALHCASLNEPAIVNAAV
ncbi:MAG: agmatine deiminase family protein [Planctomycetota bacterium]